MLALARLEAVRRRLHRSSFRDTISATAARALLYPIAGIASLVSAHVVLSTIGSSGFALYALVLSLPLLLPFSDFGLSAPVTDAASKYGLESTVFVATWRRARRRLLMVGVVVTGIGSMITVAGGWPILLGVRESRDVNLSALLACVSLAVSIYLGINERLLLGIGRQVVVVIVQTLVPLVTVACVVLASFFAPRLLYFVVAALASQIVAGLVLLLIARRALRVASLAWNSSHVAPTSVGSDRDFWSVALPMAVIATALPFVYQSDRVLLAHMSTSAAADVASYSLVALLYSPLFTVVAFGGQTLWPLFMRARAESVHLRSLYLRAVGGFAALGTFLAGSLILVGPTVVELVSARRIQAPTSLFVAFAVLLFVLTVSYPAGMLLMDPAGRWFQAVAISVMVIVKIAASVVLIRSSGATGAVWASVLADVVVLAVPSGIFVELRYRRPASQAARQRAAEVLE